MITDTQETRWGHLNDEDELKSNEWYDKYVPACGKCATLGGEILRAINKIVYRYYNDGDTVDRYYGSDYNSVKGADIFLRKYVPGYCTLSGIDEYEYETPLCKRLKYVVDYLAANEILFETPNQDDYLNYQVYEPIQWDEEEDEW